MSKKLSNLDMDKRSDFFLKSLHFLQKKESESQGNEGKSAQNPGKFVIRKKKLSNSPEPTKHIPVGSSTGLTNLKSTPLLSKVCPLPTNYSTPKNHSVQNAKATKHFLFNTFNAQKSPTSTGPTLTPIARQGTPKSALLPPDIQTQLPLMGQQLTPNASCSRPMFVGPRKSLSPSKNLEIKIKPPPRKFYFPLNSIEQTPVKSAQLPLASSSSNFSEISTQIQSKSIVSLRNAKTNSISFLQQSKGGSPDSNTVLTQQNLESPHCEEPFPRLQSERRAKTMKLLKKIRESRENNSFKNLVLKEEFHTEKEFEKFDEIIRNGVHYSVNLIRPPPTSFVDKIAVFLPHTNSTFICYLFKTHLIFG